MDQAPSDAELVTAYLRHFAAKDQTLFWAWQRVEEIIWTNPDHAWLITLALIAEAPNEMCLAYVAAGPLEDLLDRHGQVVIDRVELQARRDSKFRLALSNVWGQSNATGDVFGRVRIAVGGGSNYRRSGP
jgi:hypothetical protein